MLTMEFGWLGSVTVGSSFVVDVPLAWDAEMGEPMHMLGYKECIEKIYLPVNFALYLKFSKNKVLENSFASQ